MNYDFKKLNQKILHSYFQVTELFFKCPSEESELDLVKASKVMGRFQMPLSLKEFKLWGNVHLHKETLKTHQRFLKTSQLLDSKNLERFI